jgi:hypothetical protein
MTCSIIERLRDVLAAGTARVEKFEIPITLAPNKNGICVDMEGFRNNKKVQAQLRAAAKIKVFSSSSRENQKESE